MPHSRCVAERLDRTMAMAMAGDGFMISWSGVGADSLRSSYARVFPATGLLGFP